MDFVQKSLAYYAHVILIEVYSLHVTLILEYSECGYTYKDDDGHARLCFHVTFSLYDIYISTPYIQQDYIIHRSIIYYSAINAQYGPTYHHLHHHLHNSNIHLFAPPSESALLNMSKYT